MATNHISSMTTPGAPRLQMDNNLAAIEFLTADELAARLKVKRSWVIEATKRSRTSDPLPTVRFGRHNRYAWGSKAMTAWISRRFS